MKKILILILVCITINCFSQTDSIKKPEIQLDINTLIYNHKIENRYYSDNPYLAIETHLISMPYEKLKENMLKNSSKIIKNEIKIDGIDVLFIEKSTIKDGQEIVTLIYCKKYDSNSSISFVSIYPKEKESYYKPIIDKAFLSAKIVN